MRRPDGNALAKTHAAAIEKTSNPEVDSTQVSGGAAAGSTSGTATKPDLHTGRRRPAHAELVAVDMEHYDVDRGRTFGSVIEARGCGQVDPSRPRAARTSEDHAPAVDLG